MADTASVQERPLTLADLTDYFARGSKPKESFRVGAEHEKFGFYLGSHAPVPYEGDKGVHALLTGLQRFGWKPVMEGPTIIGLERNGANISLEPGGQFELSGAPLATMHDICDETGKHLDEVELHLCSTINNKNVTNIEYKFKDVIISSYSQSASSTGQPMESFSINFTKVDFTYKAYDRMGEDAGNFPGMIDTEAARTS